MAAGNFLQRLMVTNYNIVLSFSAANHISSCLSPWRPHCELVSRFWQRTPPPPHTHIYTHTIIPKCARGGFDMLSYSTVLFMIATWWLCGFMLSSTERAHQSSEHKKLDYICVRVIFIMKDNVLFYEVNKKREISPWHMHSNIDMKKYIKSPLENVSRQIMWTLQCFDHSLLISILPIS